MKQSEHIANLAKAMIQAQKSIVSNVATNATNDTFGSSYADLGAVIEAIKGHLNAAGIAVIQSPTLPDRHGNVCLTTRLIHETGEWMEDTCCTPMAYLDPQGFGSATSYLRRYALSSMMGLYQADDDGEAAKGDGPRVAPEPTPQTASESTGDAGSAEEIPPAVQKRVDSWLNTIKNASLERLETSRASAKTTFTGRAFEIVDQAFEERIQKLRDEKQKQPA